MNERLSIFEINSADEQHCQKTLEHLEDLTADRYFQRQVVTEGADKFVNLALEGLIVFLSCKRKGLNLEGSFVHHDAEVDQQEFRNFVSRLDPEADVALDTKPSIVNPDHHLQCFA